MSQASRLTGLPAKPKVGAKKKIDGKMMMWNGKKWVKAPNYSSSGSSNRLTGLNTTKPKRKRQLSNIPPSEGTGGRAEKTLGYGAGAKTPKPQQKPVVAPSRPRTVAPKPQPTTKSKIHTYNKHESKLHIGRYKTLKEHRAAVAAAKKRQSKANAKGWKGNQNY